MLDSESIFNLKTSSEELTDPNYGMTSLKYQQVPCTRDVTGNNFSNGAIHLKFRNSGTEWLLPSRCYIRARFRLTGPAGNPVTLADGIAPNMGFMSNLFQSAEFRIGDKTVSRISDFMPQVDMLGMRLNKSKAWLDSVGNSTNFTDVSQSIRQAQVSSNGVLLASPASSTLTTTTRVQLGFDLNTNNASYTAATGAIVFTANAGAPLPPDVRLLFPVGSYFVFTGGTTSPNSIGERMRVRTGENNTPAGNLTTIYVESGLPGDENGNNGAGQFSRVVVGTGNSPSRQAGSFELTYQVPLSFYKIEHGVPCLDGELILNPKTSADFQRSCIESVLGQVSKNPILPGGVGDFQVSVVDMFLYNAVVTGPRCENSSFMLELDQMRCQSDKIQNFSFGQRNFDISPSSYAVTVAYQDVRVGNNTALSASKFKSYDVAGLNAQELKLNRFFLNYGGVSFPSPDANPEFIAGEDFSVQRYVETIMNSGSYHDTGGSETIDEFHLRGAYYHFLTPRSSEDSSTRLTVYNGFDNTTDVTNMRILLFDSSRVVCRVTVAEGRIVQVECVDL